MSGAERGSFLVAVGPSPTSAHLVRWTRRAALALGTGWAAVHVDRGGQLEPADAERLEANLALARSLGAETLVIQSGEVAEAVIETARTRGASMIVIGRSGLSPLGFPPRRPTVQDRIVREAGAIDVAVVQDGRAPREALGLARFRRFLSAPPRQLAFLALAFGALAGLGILLSPLIGYRGLALVYLAAVLGLSFLAGPGPVGLLAVLSALALNFFFMPPRFTFNIGSAEDILLFAIYFLVASVTGSLVARLRANERLLEERERRTSFLFRAAGRIAECSSLEAAAREAASLVEAHFGAEAAVFVSEEGGRLAPAGEGRAAASLEARELAAAARAFAERAVGEASRAEERGGAAEPGAATRFRCAPAAAGEEPSGVIGLRIPAGRVWTRADDNLLLSLGRTLALAVEREHSEARSRRAALELESERLSAVLLDLVSHELKTPLTTITGSITALADEALAADKAARGGILAGALEAADRLDRIVEELLTMTRMEAGALRLRPVSTAPADIVEAALREAGPEAAAREIRVLLPEEPRLLRVDAGLLSRLAANLLRNAASYSREGAIEIRLEEEGGDLLLAVRDPGPGVPAGEEGALFERFRRGRGAPSGGIGLGLAICRGIAQAHGGSIEARRLEDGSFEMALSIPACVEGGAA